MELAATVLIPTHDHGLTLTVTLESALSQTISDIEIFVIGDGVPDITRQIMSEFMSRDKRIKFFDHPKGPRHGEIYRHAALQEASGKIVCYLSDDDIWLPHHVETLYEILKDMDFAHTLPIRCLEKDKLGILPVNLAEPFYRELLFSGHNRVPLPCAGHTLAYYRRLPYGWRTTPAGTPTDLYMWQQFFVDRSCRAVSSSIPSLVHFPSFLRKGMSNQERLAELKSWWERLQNPAFQSAFLMTILQECIYHVTSWEMQCEKQKRASQMKYSWGTSFVQK